MPQAEIDKFADFDNVDFGYTFQFNVSGEEIESISWLKGEHIYTEKYKLGEERTIDFEGDSEKVIKKIIAKPLLVQPL